MRKNDQLEVIIKESQLETTKAQYILDQFKGYFEIASEWEAKAKAIVVTDESQTGDMEKAREGRLILKEKRIAIEKSRVSLKAQALREGKAIDGISNVLKALIVPVENYLLKQEKFVEFREEAKREAKCQEIEKRMEEEEAARVKAEAEKQENIRQENIKLKKEAEERDRKDAIERKKRETRLTNERAKHDAEKKALDDKARKERKIAEEKVWIVESNARMEKEKARKEKEARDWELSKERAVAREKEEAERKEKERLAELLKNQIICPSCGYKFQRGGRG